VITQQSVEWINPNPKPASGPDRPTLSAQKEILMPLPNQSNDPTLAQLRAIGKRDPGAAPRRAPDDRYGQKQSIAQMQAAKLRSRAAPATARKEVDSDVTSALKGLAGPRGMMHSFVDTHAVPIGAHLSPGLYGAPMGAAPAAHEPVDGHVNNPVAEAAALNAFGRDLGLQPAAQPGMHGGYYSIGAGHARTEPP